MDHPKSHQNQSVGIPQYISEVTSKSINGKTAICGKPYALKDCDCGTNTIVDEEWGRQILGVLAAGVTFKLRVVVSDLPMIFKEKGSSSNEFLNFSGRLAMNKLIEVQRLWWGTIQLDLALNKNSSYANNDATTKSLSMLTWVLLTLQNLVCF